MSSHTTLAQHIALHRLHELESGELFCQCRQWSEPDGLTPDEALNHFGTHVETTWTTARTVASTEDLAALPPLTIIWDTFKHHGITIVQVLEKTAAGEWRDAADPKGDRSGVPVLPMKILHLPGQNPTR